QSVWRVWRDNNYAGSDVTLNFSVSLNGGDEGDIVGFPTTYRKRCKLDGAEHGEQVGNDGEKHFYIDLILTQSSDLLEVRYDKAYTDNVFLNVAILRAGDLTILPPGVNDYSGNEIPANHYRVYIYERMLT